MTAAAMADTRSLWQRGERQFVQIAKGLQHRVSTARERRFVFVAGMQRSGTNMVMEVLERSLATDVYHETDARAFDNYVMRDEAVIAGLAQASRAPVFVIKALCELDRLPRLMQQFAPAKTLWVVRAYDDVVNSATRSFRNFAKQVARIASDRNTAHWRGRGMSDATHALVRALYHADMNEASAAALTWYFRNVLYFEHGFDAHPDVLPVCYEQLVVSPDAQFRRLFGFLGIPYSAWISRIVSPQSIRKHTAPEIEPAVREHCDELTVRFERSLGATS